MCLVLACPSGSIHCALERSEGAFSVDGRLSAHADIEDAMISLLDTWSESLYRMSRILIAK